MSDHGSPPPPAREGSSLYYALRLADDTMAERVYARLWLQQAITDTLADVTDVGVAQHKVHWWHEEIDSVFAGTARHPAALAVIRSGAGERSLATAWLALLSVTSDRRLAPPASQDALDQALQREWRARLLLLADALAPLDAAMSDDAASALRLDNADCNALALGIGLSMQLRALPMRLRAGDPVFGDDTYRRHAASTDTLMPPASLILEQVTRADACLRQVSSAWRQAGRHALPGEQRPLRVYTRLRQTQLALWQRDLPDLTREVRVLTPLRKLLLAWRTH